MRKGAIMKAPSSETALEGSREKTNESSNGGGSAEALALRTGVLFKEQQQSIIRHTDALFSRMMLWQWVFAVGLAVWLSPRAWVGASSQVHLHVWMAILLGATISSAPVLLARLRPGRAMTRHVIAIGQML